jgi:DNA-binding protein H-NS
MGLKETTDHVRAILVELIKDLDKASRGNKAAAQRVRTKTIKLEKVAKAYRKESISAEKKEKGAKPKKATSAKKAPAKKAPAKKRK